MLPGVSMDRELSFKEATCEHQQQNHINIKQETLDEVTDPFSECVRTDEKEETRIATLASGSVENIERKQDILTVKREEECCGNFGLQFVGVKVEDQRDDDYVQPECSRWSSDNQYKPGVYNFVTVKDESDITRSTECTSGNQIVKYESQGEDYNDKFNGCQDLDECRDNLTPRLYKCASCTFATDTKRYLIQHVTVKHDPNAPLYKCNLCDFITKRKDNLTSHAKRHDLNSKVFTCEKCDFVSKYKRSLWRHLKFNHSLIATEVYKCLKCDYTATVKANLIHHVKANHDPEASANKYNVSKYATKVKKTSVCDENPNYKAYKCTECAYATNRKDNLSKHIKVQHNQNADINERNECNLTTENKAHVLRHSWLKHVTVTEAQTEVYKCSECEFTNKLKYLVNHHAKVKHDPNAMIYNCKSCSFTSKDKYLFSRHVRLQHNAAAGVYKCPQCPYTNKKRYTLNYHIKLQHNTNTRAYKCPECKYTTKVNSHLVYHIKVTHDPYADVYQCAKCDYATRRKQALIRHAKSMHGAIV